MRVGDRVIVITDHGVRHPKGTLVEVKIIGKGIADTRPYYCQAIEGNTAYWYEPEALMSEKEWENENRC